MRAVARLVAATVGVLVGLYGVTALFAGCVAGVATASQPDVPSDVVVALVVGAVSVVIAGALLRWAWRGR